jgi:spore germination protein KC
MGKALLLVLICLMPLVGLTGCYDASELDDTVHVTVIGIDKGEAEQLRLIVQFPTIKGSEGGGSVESSGEGKDQEGYTFVAVDAPSFFTGVNLLNSAIPRRLNFTHAQTLVISGELAKEGQIGELMAPIIRNRQIRRSLHVVVTRGTALDFIKDAKPLLGTSIAKAMDSSSKVAEESGYTPHSTLMNFYHAMKSPDGQPIAILAGQNDFTNLSKDTAMRQEGFGGQYYAGEIPRLGGNKTEFFGTALFDGDRMVGELNGGETSLMLMCRGEYNRGFFTIPDPQYAEQVVVLDVRQVKQPEVEVSFLEDGMPVIDLRLQLEGDILSVPSRINYESQELKPVLEEAFGRYIKGKLDDLIVKCQGLHTDVFYFGRTAVRQFNTIQAWEEYGWKQQFPYAEVNTEVEFTIRGIGTMLKSSPIVTSEGIK